MERLLDLRVRRVDLLVETPAGRLVDTRGGRIGGLAREFGRPFDVAGCLLPGDLGELARLLRGFLREFARLLRSLVGVLADLAQRVVDDDLHFVCRGHAPIVASRRMYVWMKSQIGCPRSCAVGSRTFSVTCCPTSPATRSTRSPPPMTTRCWGTGRRTTTASSAARVGQTSVDGRWDSGFCC